MTTEKGQGNQFFSKLKKFFSSSIVLKYEDGNKIKVFDVDNLQTIKNVETNRFIDKQGSVYQHFYEVGGNMSGMGFNTMRADLYRNYELMDADALISSVLDIYSEETCLRNEYGELLTINSTKDSIKSSLENLFYDVLNIEFNLPWWVRNLVKYGDFFLKLDIVESIGVTNVIPLSSYGMERYEDTGNPDLVKFKYDESLGTSLLSYTKRYVTKQELENYEIAHFRLLSDSNYLPYGRSVLENARKIWNQLTLMIDAMLIHRITRAPDKRLFYIDVGTIAPDQIEAYMQQIINKMKKIPIIDENTGEFNLRYNLQNQQEDFYLPVRGDKSGTKIDTLPGMTWTGIEDLEFLQQRMFAALKVPMAFLNNMEGLGAKSTLAAQDLRFARSIDKIQKILISELTKIAIIHLYSQGYSVEDIIDFEIDMSSPSTVYENEKIELLSNKADLVSRIKDLKLHSDKWIYNNIFGMSDEEAEEEEENIVYDLKKAFRYSQIETAGEDPEADFKLNGGDFDEKKDFDSSIDKSLEKRGEEEDLNASGQEVEETEKMDVGAEETTPEEVGRHPKIGDTDKRKVNMKKWEKTWSKEKEPEAKTIKVKPIFKKKKPEVDLYKRTGLGNPLKISTNPQKDKRDQKSQTNLRNQMGYKPRGGSPLHREILSQISGSKLINEDIDKGTFMDESVLF